MSNYPTYHDEDKVKYLYHTDDTYHKLQLQRTTDNLVSKVIASHYLSGADLRISKSTCSSYGSAFYQKILSKKTRMKYVHFIYIQISDDNILKL